MYTFRRHVVIGMPLFFLKKPLTRLDRCGIVGN